MMRSEIEAQRLYQDSITKHSIPSILGTSAILMLFFFGLLVLLA